jgi:hypothetical protein
MRSTTFVLFTLFLFIQCKQSEASSMNASVPLEIDVPASKDVAASSSDKVKSEEASEEAENLEPQQKIIKVGNIIIDVKDIKTKKNSLDKILSIHKGYYQSDIFNSNDYKSEYNTVIRVPADGFDRMLSDIAGIDGKITRRDITSEEITLEYYDVQTRLESKRKNLKRYYDFLDKAKTTKDLLEIEVEIQNTTNEIESLEGRMKVMKNQVALSTINVNLVEKFDYYVSEAEDNFFIKIFNNFKSGFEMILNLVLFLIKLWPIFFFSFIAYRVIKKRPFKVGFFRKASSINPSE